LEKTLRNRPDLLERVALSAEDKELLDQIKLEQIKLAQGFVAETGQAPSLRESTRKN